jgi:hypothetical protein
MREVVMVQALVWSIVFHMRLRSRISVADWLNKRALAVERLGPPLLLLRSGVPCREAALLIQLGGLGSAVSSPSGVWGDAPAANAAGFTHFKLYSGLSGGKILRYFEGVLILIILIFSKIGLCLEPCFLGRLAHAEWKQAITLGDVFERLFLEKARQ